MKKLTALLLAICMFVCFAACGSGNNAAETVSNSTTTETADQTQPTEETVTVNKFEQFEAGLTEKNISFEVNKKAATMVGAEEGFGYIFADDTSVELYLFDTSSDAYKEASKNNQLNLSDFGITMDVVFNGDICMYVNGAPADLAEIQNIFENIK